MAAHAAHQAACRRRGAWRLTMFGSRGSRVRYCADAWARVSAAQTRARGAHRVAVGAHRVAVRVVATPPARASHLILVVES